MAKHRGLYKRGKTWWICYAGADGRTRRESSRTTSFRDAEALLLKRKTEVNEGTAPAAKRMRAHTFKDLAERYRAWGEGRQKSFKNKGYFIRQLEDAFRNVPLRHFNAALVEGYQSKLLSEDKAPATVNRHLATLKHMFTKGAEWELTTEEVLKKVRKVKLLKENNRRLRYLSHEECRELIDACSPHLAPIVVTALNTGMRKEEILSLEWKRHVDLKHGFILLDVTKNGDRREIPINQTLREALQGLTRSYMGEMEKERGAFKRKKGREPARAELENIHGRVKKRTDSPFVFVDSAGRRYQDIKRAFNSACDRAGIKDFRFHDLRHTFASQLVMAGVDITTVKELLGHKTLTMTLRYAHLAPAHKVKAVETLDGAIKKEGSTGGGKRAGIGNDH